MGIADSQKLGCNGLAYLEEKRKKPPSYTPPMISFCRVSAARRGELRTVRCREKVAAVLCWVNLHQTSVTVTRVTVVLGSFCARWVHSITVRCCVRMRSHICVRLKMCQKSHSLKIRKRRAEEVVEAFRKHQCHCKVKPMCVFVLLCCR